MKAGMIPPIIQAKTGMAARGVGCRRVKSSKVRQTLGWIALGRHKLGFKGQNLEKNPQAETPAGRVRGHKGTPKAKQEESPYFQRLSS